MAKPMPPAPARPPGSIDFEVTDFDQARASLEEPPAGVKVLKRPDDAEPAKQRRSVEPRDRLLTPQAQDWLDSLPREVRPLDLPRAHPRIANQLAELWSNAAASLATMDDLIVDRRGGRRGFASRVAFEIVALREHRYAIERLRR